MLCGTEFTELAAPQLRVGIFYCCTCIFQLIFNFNITEKLSANDRSRSVDCVAFGFGRSNYHHILVEGQKWALTLNSLVTRVLLLHEYSHDLTS